MNDKKVEVSRNHSIPKALVVGLGSMGKRRIRLLKQMDQEAVIVGVDTRSERCRDVEEMYGIDTAGDLEEAFAKECEIAFVCTSPLSHGDIIEKCLLHGLHVFTELNLVCDKYDSNRKLAQEKGLALFLSSTFLYRDEIAYIRGEVRRSKSMLSYTYHVGQYLPDWHPWESYENYFIGDKRTNGCREIMAIDFPWLYKTFGKFKTIQAKKGKKSGLNISYPDSYLLLVEHESGVQGTIMVDVVSRKAVRNLEIYGEDLYLTWNGNVDGLRKYNIDEKTEDQIKLYESVDQQEGYASYVVENAYRNEIDAFLGVISGTGKAEYDLEEDQYILRIIDDIEESGMCGLQ